MPVTKQLESYIAPLLSLSRENRLFIADCLYTYSEEDAANVVSDDVYETMPGQFTEEEKRQRLTEAYNSTAGKSLNEVVNLMLAV